MVKNNLYPDTIELSRKIRLHALQMTSNGGSSHIGSILSIADILSVLYGRILKVNPKDPLHGNRDRFILSKGHAGAGVYAVLAECGFFDVAKLMTHYQDGSDLSGHVSHKGIPGVELSTGSLGHGLSVGTGMALSAKMDKKKFRVFVLLSDGEMDEGSNWEPLMFASHHKINNLVAIIDYNKMQSLNTISETLGLEPFRGKLQAFGWNVIEVDGHNHEKILGALQQLESIQETDAPICIIAHTTKGKGVSFMENSVLWHYRTARGSEFDSAMEELSNI